jgi:hypothetical protein
MFYGLAPVSANSLQISLFAAREKFAMDSIHRHRVYLF